MTTTQINTAELTGAALDYMTAEAVGVPPEMCIPFSTDWAHGGPLIESERVGVEQKMNGDWRAMKLTSSELGGGWSLFESKSPLEAACRAVVGAKIGPTVSVPTELVEGGV